MNDIKPDINWRLSTYETDDLELKALLSEAGEKILYFRQERIMITSIAQDHRLQAEDLKDQIRLLNWEAKKSRDEIERLKRRLKQADRNATAQKVIDRLIKESTNERD